MSSRKYLFLTAALLLWLPAGAWGQGVFCGAAGTPGCTAVHCDSSAITGWATTCTVERGPVDIVNPDGPRVHYGTDAAGVGPAGVITTAAVSLGDGGRATLTFAEPIRNVEGPDFAVFENSFNDAFLELAFVEVSSDGERFVRFPATSLTPSGVQVGPNGSVDPTMIDNLAGKYRVGYGTPFDLDELCDSAGIDVNNITHVRLADVVGTVDPDYASYDAYGNIVNDPYPTRDTVYGSGGFDLTGVAVLNQTASTEGIDETEVAAVNVWPNPATDHVCISVARAASATLHDLNGRYLAAFALQQGATVIDLSAYAAGVYILRVEGAAVKVVKR
ncbi:MAG: T9SS type A sorting domain-containing protein [Bacteroidales bacterium]|nr:T9SS type A sorting domain-containing protein [Bacteroidales bacterium]